MLKGESRMNTSREAGFSLLGVLIAVMIIGVVATIAVPKFHSMIVMANTSKIQADLSTLDAAVAVYEAQEGRVPTELSQLKDYVNDIDSVKPPKGKCRLKDGKIITLEIDNYSIESASKDNLEGARAVCGTYKAGDFGNGH